MKFIIGLGNPGKKYTNTRHNIGFRVLDEIGTSHKAKGSEKKLFFEGKFELANETVFLIWPKTFMNESGAAVRALRDEHPEFSIADLLVVLDEVYLPLGKLRLRPEGSAGGHNGLESIIGTLASPNFSRLRIGVGKEGLTGKDLTDFVLGEFDPAEEKTLKEIIPIASEASLSWVKEGTQVAMCRYNKN